MKVVITTRQILQRIGKTAVCNLLEVSPEAPRKWYAGGIPTRHWPKLVRAHGDWLTYQVLERAKDTVTPPAQKRTPKLNPPTRTER
jgi:hypothetical protein